MKDSWYNLSRRGRSIYLGQSDKAIQGKLGRDVETVAWSINNKTAAHKIGHNCYAVRRFPGNEIVKPEINAV